MPVLPDIDGQAHGPYGLEGRPALALVPPDGHIVFRGDAERVDRLTAYCRKAFGARLARSPSAPAR